MNFNKLLEVFNNNNNKIRNNLDNTYQNFYNSPFTYTIYLEEFIEKLISV